MQFFHDHASFASVMSLNQTLILKFSGIVGNQNIALGAEDGVNTWSTKSSADIGFDKAR